MHFALLLRFRNSLTDSTEHQLNQALAQQIRAQAATISIAILRDVI